MPSTQFSHELRSLLKGLPRGIQHDADGHNSRQLKPPAIFVRGEAPEPVPRTRTKGNSCGVSDRDGKGRSTYYQHGRQAWPGMKAGWCRPLGPSVELRNLILPYQFIVLFLIALLTGCGGGGGRDSTPQAPATNKYPVVYEANGSTGGIAPVDANTYLSLIHI